jgi:hypothetical protein
LYAVTLNSLLVPEVAGVGERVAEVDRVREIERRRAVIHERDVGPDVLPDAQTQLCVGAHIAPGVELDCGVAQLQALGDHVEVFLDGRERHRRRVRRDRVAKAPEEPPRRLARDPAREIPQRGVDQAEDVQRQLLGAVELPQAMPQPFAVERVRAEQLVAQDAIRDVLEDRARTPPGSERDALGTVGGADPERRAFAVGWTATQASAPGERRRDARHMHRIGLEVRDSRRLSRLHDASSYIIRLSYVN